MEGPLKKYKNFVSGYKKCYLILQDTHLTLYKGDKGSSQKVSLALISCKVETTANASRDFTLCFDLGTEH